MHIHASYGENEHAMAKAMRQDVLAILDAMKLEDARPPSKEISVFGKNIHECGTARMGNDPRTSVLNRFNQVHEAKNVFVTDGACFVTQGLLRTHADDHGDFGARRGLHRGRVPARKFVILCAFA